MSVNYKLADDKYELYIKNRVLGHWELGDKILYEMCKKYPNHNDENEIVAKIWLIGRSYAAAIERRKNAAGFEGDFYYDVVAPKLLTLGKDLDRQIDDCDSIDDILDLHGELTSAFKDITGIEKRSLASKYLHFHKPEKFYIYDSRAMQAVSKLVPKDQTLSRKIKGYIRPNRDDTYVDFFFRVLELKEYLDKKYKTDLQPKELDRLLLSE